MRLLILLVFFGVLGLVGYIRGREVTYKEQSAWVLGALLVSIMVTALHL